MYERDVPFIRMIVANQWVALDRQAVHALLVERATIYFGQVPPGYAPLLPPGDPRGFPGFSAALLQTARDWCGEAQMAPAADRYFVLGSWLIVQRPARNWYVAQARFPAVGAAPGAFVPPKDPTLFRSMVEVESYRSMWQFGHIPDMPNTHHVRELLVGRGSAAPIGLAVGTAALFLGEVRRNHVTWPINLMMLDLIDAGILTWREVFFEGAHSMAAGGTQADSTPEGGGLPGSDVYNKEVDIAMAWFAARNPSAMTGVHPADAPRNPRLTVLARQELGMMLVRRLADFAAVA